jgi:hypothetical protein
VPLPLHGSTITTLGNSQVKIKKGSFWWRDIVKLLGKFKSMSSVIVAEGNSVLFWKDRWIGQPLDLTYPELFSFVKNGNVTFKSVASNFEVSGIFNLPLSTQAHQQLNLLHQSLSNRQIRDGRDTWVYRWGNSFFSTSKTYKFLSSGTLANLVFRWIWKSRCQMKHKVFFWLLLVDRLNTRGLLQRKGMVLDSYTCDLCILQLPETNAHLFLQCNFAKACWNSIGVNYSSSETVLQIFEKIKKDLALPFFMEIIILLAWSIWQTRNSWIFNNIDPSVQCCRRIFKKEFSLVLLKAKPSLLLAMDAWIQDFHP